MAAVWVDPAVVQEHVGGAGAPAATLAPYIDAAARYVQTRRLDLVYTSPATVPPDVQIGVALLAARLYGRRGTALGLANYGEFGPAAILRADPDLARMLGIGVHTLPAIG